MVRTHTLSSQDARPPSAPHPVPESCRNNEYPPLAHSEREAGHVRQVSAASKMTRQARWHWFPFFQVSAGAEAENWPLEAPLAELCEFMKRKKGRGKKHLRNNCSKKIPTGLQLCCFVRPFPKDGNRLYRINCPRARAHRTGSWRVQRLWYQKKPNSKAGSASVWSSATPQSLGVRICKMGILIGSSHGSKERVAVRCLAPSTGPWNAFAITGLLSQTSSLLGWERARESIVSNLQLNS